MNRTTMIPSESVLLSMMDRDDGFRMPPPDAGQRPKKAQKRKLSTKIVLEEEAYVDALSQIIERDYFPDTAKLRRHLDLLNARDGNDLSAISALHQQILTEQRRSSSTPSSSHALSHRMSHLADDSGAQHFEHVDNSATVQTDGLTVDEFLREYTSEDNESFEILQQRDLEKRRHARHWAYENKQIAEGDEIERKPGMLMLYHMDGKVLTVKERNRIDAFLELPKSIGDDRPNNLDTWRFRVRNQLMFPPSIEDTRCKSSPDMIEDAVACDSTTLMDSGRTLIDNGSSSTSRSQHLSLTNAKICHLNKRVGVSTRAAKIIQRGNTSLRHHHSDSNTTSAHSGITPSPLEPAHTPSVISESFSDSSSVNYYERERVETKRAYKILSMTPSPMPGGGGESPLMTWGLIGGTPLILDPPDMSSSRIIMNDHDSAHYQRSLQSMGLETSSGGYSGTMYQPPAMQPREILLHTLGSREKARKALMKEKEVIRLNASHSLSSSHRRSSSCHSRTPGTRNQHNLTPAAQCLAARLLGKGGDSSLRQSLNTHSGTSFGGDALTLSYSRPAVGVRLNKVNKSHRSTDNSGSGSGRRPIASGTTPSYIQSPMNTDNLLNI